MRKRLILFVSAVCLGSLAIAGPYTNLDKRLKEAKSDAEALSILQSNSTVGSNDELGNRIETATTNKVGRPQVIKELRKEISMAASFENASTSPGATDSARKIKRSPLYSDQGVSRKQNWLGQALERLKNINIDQKQRENQRGPDLGALGQVLYYFIWAILIGAVLFLLYYLLRFLDWRNALTRKAKAVLEEDEPARTLDEWLEYADKLVAEGKFREAVRALYLACLLKFDDSGIARFERGQTNWEHLRRIEASPNLPTGLDFREPTKRFDQVWYGFQVRGMSDVEEFRSIYEVIKSSVGEAK